MNTFNFTVDELVQRLEKAPFVTTRVVRKININKMYKDKSVEQISSNPNPKDIQSQKQQLEDQPVSAPSELNSGGVASLLQMIDSRRSAQVSAHVVVDSALAVVSARKSARDGHILVDLALVDVDMVVDPSHGVFSARKSEGSGRMVADPSFGVCSARKSEGSGLRVDEQAGAAKIEVISVADVHKDLQKWHIKEEDNNQYKMSDWL